MNLAQPRSVTRLAALALLAGLSAFATDYPNATPFLDRLEPFGGTLGTAQQVIIVGERLSNTVGVEFDSPGLAWVETLESSWGKLRGKVEIHNDAALGPHIVTLLSKDGRSNSLLFYVDQFPSVTEREPNDRPPQAQSIELRAQTLHGAMPELVDIDVYAFDAPAGERWTFDLRSLEYGGFLECNMTLRDAEGRQVAFNDDRDDYLETPFLEHVFEKTGRYYLTLDQYRGPQRVDCSSNCGYMLRISQLPLVEAVFPLGARAGSDVRLSIRGRALGSVDAVYLRPIREGEYYRLTLPFTMPLRLGQQAASGAPGRIEGKILSKRRNELEAEFAIPQDAPAGLWRLWISGPNGAADDLSFEVSRARELRKDDAVKTDWQGEEIVINGALDHDGEQDSYWLQARAGQPLNVSTLTVQLGLPYIDPVLELFAEDGALLAEHDDLMSGQGTVIGNPDANLIYVPEEDQRLRLVVRDRIGRGGPSFVYRLKIANRPAGFRLLTDPQNPAVPRGAETEFSVLLIPEPGFEGTVDVWAEGLPPGVEASQGRFRADQFFGPSADGDNVIIPEVFLRIAVPENLPPGDYPLRVLGRRAPGEPVVEAFTALWIGPRAKRNDVRRPLPKTLLTVVDRTAARLSAVEEALHVPLHGSATLTVHTSGLAPEAPLRLSGLPAGVEHRFIERNQQQVQIEMHALDSATAGQAELIVEADAGGRWIATEPIALTVTLEDRQTSSR